MVAIRFEEPGHDQWWPIDDIAAVAAVRRAASAAASGLGFGESRTAEVAIVAAELATNLVRHARGGELVLRTSGPSAPEPRLRMLALDSGPGRRNIVAMITDGASSTGTLGVGLGACARLANHFDVHSSAGVGTVVEVLFQDARAPVPRPRSASLTRPLAGELPCGDAVAIHEAADTVVVMVADGLGHGPLAAEASRLAEEVFHEHHTRTPAAILERMHEALARTRGAAVSVLRLDRQEALVTHAGVGNVSTRLLDGSASRTLAPQPGIVGHRMPRVRDTTQPVDDHTHAVLHTDGLTQKWSHDELGSVLSHSPAATCAVLMRSSASGRDDAGVLTMELTR